MRHRVTTKKLNRHPDQRRALVRNLLTEFFRHERIRTTDAKARVIRPEAERIITIAKRGRANGGDLVFARRRIAAILRDPLVARKVVDTVAPRYQDRKGGYTRLQKIGQRLGDAAPMVFLELVD